MAKAPEKEKLEFHPDAWARFERAIDVAAKAPPQHRKAKKKKKAPPKRGRKTQSSS
jgi:hypothetical protein